MRLRPSITTASLLCTALLLPAGAAHAEGPKVRVLPYQPIARQATPELCAQITEKLSEELAGLEGISLVKDAGEQTEDQKDEGQAARDKAVDTARAALDKALNRADGGNKLVKKQKFDPAIKALEDAVVQFDKAAPALTDVSPLVQAHVDLAVALWKRGREDEAQAQMQAAIRLDPDYKPDPKEYWPLFLRVYDQQWRKALREPRAKLKVDATVPGAEVFFNGKSVGAVPLQLINVVPGRHFVRVVKDGAGAYGAVVTVESDGNGEFTADLGGGAAAGGGLGPVAQAVNANLMDVAGLSAARALGKASGADFVVFGGVQKGEANIAVATFLVSVADGKAARLVDLEFDLDLLNLSVESFKLTEELSAKVKDFGEVLTPGATPIIRGVAGAEEKGATEVDVGPPLPEAQGKPTEERRTVNPDDEEGGTRAIGAGEEGGEGGDGTKPRRSRRGGLAGAEEKPDTYKPKRPLYITILTNPLWAIPIAVAAVSVVVLVVAVAAAAATGGGFAGYFFLAPAQTATAKSTWPK